MVSTTGYACPGPDAQLAAELGLCLTIERPTPGEYGVMIAFGPGLTTETALLRF
jgi:predicted naringenin-chalcone synthase